MRAKSGLYLAGVVFLGATDVTGQSSPAMIQTVVAQAEALHWSGPPAFYDHQAPPQWPIALTPLGATIVGGSASGASGVEWYRTAVFSLPPSTTLVQSIERTITSAGYVRRESVPDGLGGFVSLGTEVPWTGTFCKGNSAVMFALLDSVQSPGVVALRLVDSRAGNSMCNPVTHMVPPRPIKAPILRPPVGAKSLGGGGCTSGNDVDWRVRLITSIPVDSLLSFYVNQLVAQGWSTSGAPTQGNGVAMQRFSFPNGAGEFLIMDVDGQKDLRLMYAGKN